MSTKRNSKIKTPSSNARLDRLCALSEAVGLSKAPRPAGGRLLLAEIVHLEGRNGVVGFEWVRGKPEPRFYEISPVARPASRRKAAATGARS